MDYEGYLIQGNDSKIYLIINHQRHFIPDSHIFNHLFITRDRIEYVDKQDIENYEEGQPLSKYTRVVKSLLGDTFYLDNENCLYECNDDMIYNSGLRWLDYKITIR